MDDWLHPLLRFAHYALLLGLFGLLGFRELGLGRLAAAGNVPELRGIVFAGAILAPVISSALILVAIAEMMGQQVAALKWATIEVMVASTSLGWAFAARLALLIAAIGALALPLKTWSRAASAILLGLAVATLPWSGHAAANEGGLGLLHRLNDALHLLASGLWLGAIGWFAYLVLAAHRQPDRPVTATLLETMHRFAPLGATLVGIVAVTGILNAHLVFGLEMSIAVLGTPYGVLLAIKIALVGAMLLFAARNARLGRRAARESLDGRLTAASLLPQLRSSLLTELSLAALVIGCVALLGLMSPMA